MDDPCVRAWFCVVENLAVDALLGTSFMDRYINGIFWIALKVLPSLSRLTSILSSSPTIH